MNNRSTTLLGATTLLCGVAIGASVESWPGLSRVAANADRPGAPAVSTASRDNNEVLRIGSRRLAVIAKRVTPSVVHIQSTQRTEDQRVLEETGSGVIVGNENVSGTFVITNWHVVRGAELGSISIHLSDGRVLHPVRIWSDNATDLAVMKISAPQLIAAQWGDSDRVEMGHMVLALGSPFGLSQSMSFGIISAKGRRALRLGRKSRVLNQDFLQTDAAINPGNSGGPLIDLNGRVIGINTAIASNSGGNDGIGFSIPSNMARRVVDQLLVRGKVQRAYLGVKLDANFNAEAAQKLGLDRARGARILQIYPNTPASAAALKVDDVVLKFNGTSVVDENHLINLVSLTPVGNRVNLLIVRDGRRQTIQVNLADRDELVRRAEQP